MAWIELHQSLPNHRKVLSVADALDIDEVTVMGHLCCFWLWAVDNAPDGTLTGNARTIAKAARWTGEPAAFISALVNAGGEDKPGFLTVTEGGYAIHDWWDYAGKLIEKREANAARMRNARAGKEQRTDDTRATHVQCTNPARAGATVPNSTVPNSTSNTPPLPPAGGNGADLSLIPEDEEEDEHAFTYPEWFEAIWTVYPNKAGKRAAYNAAMALTKLPKGEKPTSMQALLQAVKAYVAECQREDRRLKNLATFFSRKEMFWQEYLPGVYVAATPTNGSAKKSGPAELPTPRLVIPEGVL